MGLLFVWGRSSDTFVSIAIPLPWTVYCPIWDTSHTVAGGEVYCDICRTSHTVAGHYFDSDIPTVAATMSRDLPVSSEGVAK